MSGKLWRWRHLHMLLFFSSTALQLISGSDDPSSSKNGKTISNSSSSSSNKLDVLYVCLGVIVAVLLAVFLFKLWQKKKRAEQHARLLRLFEEDDELELELGLRD